MRAEGRLGFGVIEFDGPREWRRNDWLDLVEFARPAVASLTVVLREKLPKAPEPAWPEDISLARPNGTVLFASVAHERMSWVSLLPEEAAVLERSYGRLRSKLRRVDDRGLR